MRIQSFVTKDYVGLDKDLDSLFHLEHRQGVDKRIIYLDPAHQVTPDNHDVQKVYASDAKTMSVKLAEAEELDDILAKRGTTLCQTIAELLDYRGIRYPKPFAEYTDVCDALFNKSQNNKVSTTKKDTLMSIAISLRLNAYATTTLMKKAGIHLNRETEPDRSYLFMLERIPGISINDANEILEAKNLEPLGTKYRDQETRKL